MCHGVCLTDLPEPERLAYLRGQIEDLHLDPGDYDDAAHDAFMQVSHKRRERAERKAAIARLLVSLGPTVKSDDRLRLVHDRYGVEGASKPRLKDILRAVKGVDPINYAPALLACSYPQVVWRIDSPTRFGLAREAAIMIRHVAPI
jgi:putative transposase